MPLAPEELPTQWYRSSDRVSDISLRLRQTTHAGMPGANETVANLADISDSTNQRRMLWIDGVGGYLVMLGNEITIGQPAPSGSQELGLPILADLAPRHARLARTGGSYMLTPYDTCTVAGKPIEGPTVLADGVCFTLGSVELRLRRPHALSASALLTVESGHRTTPTADAILLMAESCVMGPKPHSHIRCSKWTDEVILFRGSEGLVCRSTGRLLTDGQTSGGPTPIFPGKRIEGQDFAFCLEEV